MSLVNQMLQDLQQRDAVDSKPLAGLHAVPVRPQVAEPVYTRRWWQAAFFLLSVLGLTLVFFRPQLDSAALPVSTANPKILRITETAESIVAEADIPPSAAPELATLASLATNQLDYYLRAPPSRPRVMPVVTKPKPLAVVAGKKPATEAKTAVVETPAAAVIKKPVSVAAALRLDGLAALRAGRPIAAEQQFEKLVAADPANPESYLLLHAALSAQSRHVAARSVLADGLLRVTNTVQIARVLASELLADGRINHALAVLTTHRPKNFADLDYEAQLAAVNQRAGHHDLATRLYQQLVGLQPENAVWWVGLAISQEATGDARRAQQSFATATTNGTLDATLARYAEERLAHLGAGS